MKQFSWNHIDQRGKIHKVGLLHGSKTGHVLIHVNGKISSLDFKVLDNKQYSFFIDEELIELNIIRHDDHYEYTMQINEEIKTPLNEKRKKEAKKMGFQTLLFFGFMAVAIFGGTWWMMQSDWYTAKNDADYQHLAKLGTTTKAKLFVNGGSKYKYQFVTTNSQVIKGRAKLPHYPIQDGDEYMANYLPNTPSIHEIYFTKPTPYQLERISTRVRKICMDTQDDSNENTCACMVDAIIEIGGFNGLYSYINRDVEPSDNPKFNRDSFLALVGSVGYREYFLRHCGE